MNSLAHAVALGCFHRFCGRPVEDNPYSHERGPEFWQAWRYGWYEANRLLDFEGETEARRWLEGEAA